MKFEELFDLIAFALAFLLVGGLPIIVMARFLRRRRFAKHLSFPVALVMVHSAVILFCIALYPTDIFVPDIPFDDVYIPFLFFPGILVYWIGQQAADLVWPWLQGEMSFHSASIMCIIFIPGLVGLVFGGVQWYFIGLLIKRFIPNPTPRELST
jgi:hypothetical protein